MPAAAQAARALSPPDSYVVRWGDILKTLAILRFAVFLSSGLAIEHLTVKFGDVEAVKDVSLNVDNGEFFTILGPSGCGKTTTLRSVAGFMKVASGEIS